MGAGRRMDEAKWEDGGGVNGAGIYCCGHLRDGKWLGEERGKGMCCRRNEAPPCLLANTGVDGVYSGFGPVVVVQRYLSNWQ